MASRKRAVLSGSAENALPESAKGDGYSYLPWVDLICAGVPCQDVSIAGKRAGLAGARTRLFYEFARILRELRPTWFLFENVPGLLSSNDGRDFAEVLRVLMVECGYGVSWRVLDSQFFGVAQRRRRVFIVGRFGKPCPPEVLFEPEGGDGDIATGREARKDVAVPLTSGTGVTGNSSGRHQEDDYNIVTSYALSGNQRLDPTVEDFIFEARFARNGRGGPGPICPPLKAESGQTGKGDGAPIVIQDVRSIEKGQHGLGIEEGGLCPTLGVAELHGVAYTCGAIDAKSRGRGYSVDEAAGGRLHVTTAIRHLGSGGADDNDAQGGFLHVSEKADANGVRDFASLPEGLDSARYRALGNAVTTSVIEWIGRRILAADRG